MFGPEAPIPVGYLRQTADTARELLPQFAEDLSAPEAIRRYFELHYWKKSGDWDRHRLVDGDCFTWRGKLMDFKFRQAAERYRLIEETGTPVVVPWGDAGRDLSTASSGNSDRALYRKMQRSRPRSTARAGTS